MKIVLLTLALVACEGAGGVKQAEVSGAYGDGEVRTIKLDDGTKCAVLIGYRKGAIDCNWGTAK